MMRRRPTEREDFRKCRKHDEDEVLFCRETGCQMTICIRCLSEAHLGHKAVELKNDIKDILPRLLKSIEITSKKLNAKIKNVEDISQDATRKTETSLLQISKERDEMIQRLNKERDEMMKRLNKGRDEMVQRLEKKKEEMIKQYDGMTRQAEDEKNKVNKDSGNELTAMRDSVVFLNSIKQSIEEEENTFEDALQKLDTVNGVIEIVHHLPHVKNYEYSEYVPGHENTVGKLFKKEKYMQVLPSLKLQGEGK